MNTGYRYRMSSEEAVSQSYGSSSYRMNLVENRIDTGEFRMLNTAPDNCIDAPGLESVFRSLPIVEDNFHRIMEPPGWNVFRMNPMDYRWINNSSFMSSFRNVPTDNDQSNRGSTLSMNANDQILRAEPESASIKFVGNFGDTRFTNGYSTHSDTHRFQTCFGTVSTSDNINGSSDYRVHSSTDNSFINVNTMDRTAVTSVGEFGINSTIVDNAHLIKNFHMLNQTPTKFVRFNANSSGNAQCKLDSMSELVRTSFSAVKSDVIYDAMEAKVRNCQSVDVAKSYHQMEEVVDKHDSVISENKSGITRNKLTVKKNVKSKCRKVKTGTDTVTDDVKKILKINKLKKKNRKKLNMSISIISEVATNSAEHLAEKGNRLLPVLGAAYEMMQTDIISSTPKEDRFALLVNDKGSFLKPVKVDRRRKRHECKVCGKVVKKSKYLVVHMIIHTGDKPYTCAVCEKRFSQQQHLKRHERIHTGERPYVCVVCDKRFARDENLDRHILAHTKVKNYSCPVCSRQFVTRGAVKMHLMIHTGEQPFECNVCSKRFRQQENMNRHMTTHTGEKNFHCKQCNKLFASKQLVKIHQISHTDVRPFVCTVCKKTYKAADSLRAHMKRKHYDVSSASHKRH